MQKVMNGGTETIELLPGAVLEVTALGPKSYANVFPVNLGDGGGFISQGTAATGKVTAGPFAGLVVLRVEAGGRVGLVCRPPTGVPGAIPALINPATGALVGAASFQPSVDYRSFMPSNPGTTSNAVALAAAIDAAIARNAVELVLPAGDFYLPSVVTKTITNGLRIVGQGGDKTRIQTDSTAYCLDLRGGTVGSPVTVTANVAAGDTQITVSNGATFAANQFVNLQSSKIWDLTSGKAAKTGELARIKTVAGTVPATITFWEPLRYSYLTANSPTLSPCHLSRGIRFEGIGFYNRNPLTAAAGAAGGVVFRQFSDLLIDDVYGELLDGPLLTYIGIHGGEVRNVTARWLADDETNGRYGYVHNLADATTGLRLLGGSSFACRHHVTTNAGGGGAAIGGVPVDNQCVGAIARAYTNVAFDTHEEGDSTLFADCQAVGCMDTGFGIRAPRSSLMNCVVAGGKGTGVQIRATATRSEVLNVKVTDLTGVQSARANPTVGIDIQCQECLVDGFRIEGVGQSGIRILGANRAQIRNGRIFDFGTSAGNEFGIHFSGSSLDHEIQDVRIDGNGRANTRGLLAAAAAVTGVKVANVTTRRVSTPALNIPNVTTQTVQGTAVTETVINSTLA